MDIIVDFVSTSRDGLEMSIVSDELIQTYHFKNFQEKGDDDGGGDGWWDTQLSAILSSAVANFPRLYAYGDIKCAFLSKLAGRKFVNLESLGCPRLTRNIYHCGGLFLSHRLPTVRCAARRAQLLYDWLARFHNDRRPTHHRSVPSVVAASP